MSQPIAVCTEIPVNRTTIHPVSQCRKLQIFLNFKKNFPHFSIHLFKPAKNSLNLSALSSPSSVLLPCFRLFPPAKIPPATSQFFLITVSLRSIPRSRIIFIEKKKKKDEPFLRFLEYTLRTCLLKML